MDFANEARIELSTLCNLNCSFCTHNNLKRKKEIMSFDLLKLVLNKIKNLNINQITISGFGETFMDKDVVEKIEYIRSQGYDINVLTNGTLLTYDLIDFLFNIEVKSLRISIHTINVEKYKNITKANDILFERLIHNLKYMSTKRNNKTKIIATNVVNDGKISDIIEYIQPLVDELEIWKPHNWGNALNYRNNPIVKNTCGRLFKGPLQVQVDGTVNACCFDYDGQLLLGDLKTQTIEEIFSSETYLKLREHHTTGEFPDIICKTCDQRMDYNGLVYSTVKGDRTHMFSSSYERME